ncbi:chorismate mutase [Halanaerobium salsuginis]|jgi:chorismate mutase|uniref:chorismate mutase n=1 Tax=Halanaerobium salsuginis TaxID=29563 RepID=A0A1I4ELZ0_9FIRM|nr:chorismate mutase [Halanaerobium salsuginis]SFL06319.1 chorismate mutase [Halanaerobium salsuginis]
MYALRGAISVENNKAEDIRIATQELMQDLMQANELNESELISIISSATNDLDQLYPGKAIRELGYQNTPILCLQEMKVENSSPKMIRLLIHVDGSKESALLKHSYLKRAKNLRPDLIK